MERGETGPGRDAYDLPKRPSAGSGRHGGGPGGPGVPAARPYESADGYPGPLPERGDQERTETVEGPVGEDDYGLLMRRPGEMPSRRQRLRQPGGPRPRHPGRFPPSGPSNGGVPNGTWPTNGVETYGAWPAESARPNGGRPGPGTANAGASGDGVPGGGPLDGQAPGYHYRLPNGRRIPPAAYRMYRSQTAGGSAGQGPAPEPYGGWNRRAPDPYGEGPYDGRNRQDLGPDPQAGQPEPYGGWNRRAPDPHGQGWGRSTADADPRAGGWNRQEVWERQGGAEPGRGGADGWNRQEGRERQGGAEPGRGSADGWNRQGAGTDPRAGGWNPQGGRPGAQPGQGAGGTRGYGGAAGGIPPVHERARTAGRLSGPDGLEPGGLAPEADASGPVIRQRETALPDKRPLGAAQPVASIAPDGLESFARDLRALRAKAELEYPEMAETSHYTMKTLASAAGGLRLPTLPVAVAYVRACGGNVAEWEERWQKLATTITVESAKKHRPEGEEQEPADASAEPLPVTQAPEADSGEVYVITSAKPRQPGW